MKPELLRRTVLCALLGTNLAALGNLNMTHSPSGLTFPEKIEMRLTRSTIGPASKASSKLEVDYQYLDGTQVTVNVFSAQSDAKGPRILDGDSRSDATTSFMKEFESLKANLTKGDTSFHSVSQNRFQAAPHKKGPIGMKVTLKGDQVNHDLLLCERNGYFVSFSVTYPTDEWLKYSPTYTDVAHFVVWPNNPHK